MQQSVGEDESKVAENLRSVLATHPPIQQWSRATVEGLKSAVNSQHAEAEWHEESIWTRNLINAVLALNEGWNWQRLRTCSNTDYFSLPTHTISLLNAVFHTHAIDKAKARVDAGHYSAPLNLDPAASGTIGYPIFRVDYSNDEYFELYKMYWDQILEEEFYVLEAVDPDDVTWYWVDDEAKLDGKGPQEVRQLFQSLCATYFPPGLDSLWVCLMVDREAIESMLRVYGPPAKEVPTFRPPNLVRKKDISLLPYLTAVATNWKETSGNKRGITGGTTRQVNDGEYHGQFKCAVRCIFVLWNNEQVIEPQRSFPGHGKIWGDNEILYEAPSSH